MQISSVYVPVITAGAVILSGLLSGIVGSFIKRSIFEKMDDFKKSIENINTKMHSDFKDVNKKIDSFNDYKQYVAENYVLKIDNERAHKDIRLDIKNNK
jgi:hypothetical protein